MNESSSKNQSINNTIERDSVKDDVFIKREPRASSSPIQFRNGSIPKTSCRQIHNKLSRIDTIDIQDGKIKKK